uniref:PEP-CTERM sorting domain-containing protein n=1 Tax=Armatimonas sp. TaxID=1872638 RepID=UPI00286CAD73
QRITPGRDRFLKEPVLTTEALVEALKTEPSFRRNIAKHFNLPEDRVVEFVEDALVPYILPTDTSVMNYGVTKSGLIYGKKMSLKKGTRVWATRDGKPILKWICSNPLLPKAPVLKEKPKITPVASTARPLGLQQVAANLTAPAGLDALEGGDLSPFGPDMPVAPPIRVTPPIKVVEIPNTPDPIKPVAPPVLPRFIRTGLPLLPLAGVAGAVVRSVKIPKSTEEEVPVVLAPATTTAMAASRRTTHSAVPEPGTLVFAALGLAGLPLLRRKK